MKILITAIITGKLLISSLTPYRNLNFDNIIIEVECSPFCHLVGKEDDEEVFRFEIEEKQEAGSD